ncbi:hypothetical protein FSARC_5112 [Fusarium sarcochroum]|uniref:Uncharacterized protein n=1 Tax=Fusarium sarcochroum TaxID=1208366 RepID=A0A8H4U0A7_9HYPO|nr:hypothetical protein FSARC_5112 [Fusarium sarcochroum]
MTTTMLYTTGASMEEPMHRFTPTTNSSGRPRHRPKALKIQPLDPSELSAKLSDLSVEHDGQSGQSVHLDNSLKPPMSARSIGAPSPRTIPPMYPASSVTTMVSSKSPKKEKVDDKLSSPSLSKPPRRGSIFDAFRFRGSNYSDELQKKDDEDAQKPARYKHVPQVAAQQFARTTTVEPITQKSSPKGTRPVPGPHSMNNGTMSLQEYNRQYRRAQSLCSGKPNGAHNFSKLASTAEMDEGSAQQKKQNTRGSIYGRPELPRRMSTGDMWGKSDPQPQSPFRRDSTGVGGFQGNSASSARRGSASSSGFSDVSSPFARESGPTTPFRQDFGGNSPLHRRGSENSSGTSGSRRGSLAGMANPQRAAEIHRVDWSQSDQPVKVRRDSKWAGLKHRKTSVSQLKPSEEKEVPYVIETTSQSFTSPKSPKTGFLKRFMH